MLTLKRSLVAVAVASAAVIPLLASGASAQRKWAHPNSGGVLGTTTTTGAPSTTTAAPSTTTTVVTTTTSAPSTTTTVPPTTSAPAPSTAALSWPAPPCGDSSHGCITLPVSDTGSHQYLSLSSANDYHIVLPAVPVRGGLTLYGGHNVIIIGGEIDLPTPCTTDGQECHGVNISRSNADTGTVHIEGVWIHNPDPTASSYTGDGIDVNTAQGTDLQLENLRIDGIDGCDSGVAPSAHADVFQPYGGVHDIRVDGLTGTSDFQGMEVKEGDNGSSIHSAIYRRVNMTGLANPHGCTGSQYLWWLTSTAGGFNCTVYPTTLDRAYAKPAGSLTILQGVLWPDTATNFGCPAVVAFGTATWPLLTPVSGGITQGSPASGDFVPVGLAGIQYVSPGYL